MKSLDSIKSIIKKTEKQIFSMEGLLFLNYV